MAEPKGKLLDSAAIAARLRATRGALGLTQRDLCRESGIGESAYNQFERGHRPLTLVPALRLCERFGLTLDWFYRGDRSGLPERITARLPRFALIETEPEYLGAAEPQRTGPPPIAREEHTAVGKRGRR